MLNPALDKQFAGSIPHLYQTHLVPVIFAPYAVDMASRLRGRRLERVLEVAAGTGVVTRALAASLPAEVAIVATDLNQAMLDEAGKVGTSRPVAWQQADVAQLPFGDGAFDAVVCQFGVMFFPDKAQSLGEIRRVLKARGVLIFSVWDRLADNEFTDCVTDALATLFPDDPPRFMARTPHGYHDRQRIEDDLRQAGFTAPIHFETRAERGRAESAEALALAFCQGTPLRNEIEARDPTKLEAAMRVSTEALQSRFGAGPLEGKIQAHVVTVEH